MKKDIEYQTLEDYMITSRFRTVEREQFEGYHHGAKEVPVVIDLDDRTIARLSFPVPKRKQIFGYATAKGRLLEIYSEVLRIYIEPNPKDYTFSVTVKTHKDYVYAVKEQEIIDLLEGALRVPSQR